MFVWMLLWRLAVLSVFVLCKTVKLELNTSVDLQNSSALWKAQA